MARLNILGAQRVKALIEILHEKRDEALAQARASIPSEKDIQRQMERETGVDALRIDLELAVRKAQEIADEINSYTGENLKVRAEASYYSPDNRELTTTRRAWERNLTTRLKAAHKPLEDIHKEYKAKEQQLWLCETLEEAKEIVGID